MMTGACQRLKRRWVYWSQSSTPKGSFCTSAFQNISPLSLPLPKENQGAIGLLTINRGQFFGLQAQIQAGLAGCAVQYSSAERAMGLNKRQPEQVVTPVPAAFCHIWAPSSCHWKGQTGIIIDRAPWGYDRIKWNSDLLSRAWGRSWTP